MKKFFKVYLPFTANELKRNLTYKGAFYLFIFCSLFGTFINYFLWMAIYGSSSSVTLGGLTRQEMVVYVFMSYVTAALSMIGISDIDHLFTDNIWLVAWRYVINGSFDRYMLRPLNVFFQVISEKLQPDALGELLIGFTLVGISLGKEIVIVDFAHVVLFIVSVIAGAIIYTSIKLFFATTAFWVKISGPFLQVAYLPASYFLMADKSWLVIVVECVIALVFWVVAYGFFNYGISKYESAGN